MPCEKKWAVHTGWWGLPGPPEAKAPGDGCPALEAEWGLAEPPATQRASPSWPHPDAGREAAHPPNRLQDVAVFSHGPGPETGAPCPLTPSSFPSTQDTADYVKPVTFWVEYSLEDPDHGPVLDDGWPSTLRVSVHPCIQGTQPGRSIPHPHLLLKAQIQRAPGTPSPTAGNTLRERMGPFLFKDPPYLQHRGDLEGPGESQNQKRS